MISEKTTNIGDKVYRVYVLGHISTGYDVQILDYIVGWKGKDTFIPVGFGNNKYEDMTIRYCDCYKTLEEAQAKAATMFDGPVTFEKINGDAYDVIGKHKERKLCFR